MTVIGWLQIVLFCAIVVALAPLLGGYMTRVFNGERTAFFAGPAAGGGRVLPGRAASTGTGAALAHLHGRDAAVSCRGLCRFFTA